MPNLKASKKGVKVIAKKTITNNDYTAIVKNNIKKCDKAILEGNTEEATKIFQKVQMSIDNAVSKGVIKKNTADRQKKRLSSKIKALKK